MAKTSFHRAGALLFGLAIAGAASAQSVAPTAPNMPNPRSTVPEKVDPPQTSVSGDNSKPLSEKLESTGGVITPRGNVDPGITVPAPVPNPGTTPVIPPPGSPGGNPTVQPK